MLKVFGIFDTKADAFNTPFFMSARGQAVRAFADLVNDKESTLYKHPDDYRLAYLGEFDPKDGRMLPAEKVEFICGGADFAGRDS